MNKKYLVLLGISVCVAISVTIYMLHSKDEERPQDEELFAKMKEERLRVYDKLQSVASLPDKERAQAIWEFWLSLVEEHWEQPAYSYACERIIMPELEKMGRPAMEVMLESIRHAPSVASNEASWHLSMFAPEATYALIDILKTSTDRNVQHEVLMGLCSCVSTRKETEEEQQAISEAVTPFVTGPDESLRDNAELVLWSLDQ